MPGYARATPSWIAGVGILAVALVAAAVLYVPSAWVADLGPQPDASEYAVAARNLAHMRGFTIELLGRAYPPRFPVGFSLLVAPIFWLLGSSLANAIYPVVAFGVATAVLTYTLARRMSGVGAGLAAAGVLLLRPVFVEWNHQVMTETASAAGVIAVALLLYRCAMEADDRRRRRLLLLIGALCGVEIMIRITNGVLVLALGALLLDSRVRTDWRRSALSLALGPALALAAHAALNLYAFGSVTLTGYHYWVPYWHSSLGKTFSPTYALDAPASADPGRLGVLPNILYYGDFLLRSISSAGFLIAAAYGALVQRRRHGRGDAVLVAYTGLLTGGLYTLYSLYFFQSGRFMAPILPLIAALTGVGVRSAAGLVARPRRSVRDWILGGSICVLAAGGAFRAFPLVAARSYLWQHSVLGAVEPPVAQPLSATSAAYRRIAGSGAVVITAVPLTFLEQLSRRDVRIVGVVRRSYWRSDHLRGSAVFAEHRDTIAALIRDGRAVYTDAHSLAVLQAATRDTAAQSAMDAMATFRLVPVESNGAAVVYRLTIPNSTSKTRATSTTTGVAR